MKRPRLNMLRTFEVAGRRLSFSLAAEELNVSQAAVSQQIRNLEAYLGSPLFIRNHRQLRLNSIGVAYLSSVQEALDRLDTVTDQLFPDRPNQTVTIRCTSSIASLWLAPNVGKFNAQHPDIKLRIQTLDSGLDSGLDTGQYIGADLEIFISKTDASDPQTKLLLTSSIIPVAAPGVFETQPQTPKDILEYEFIHVLGYDDDWHRWFRTHGLTTTPVPQGLMVDGSLIAIESVLRGDAIMLGRRPFIDAYLHSGQLVEAFQPPLALTANYYLRRTPSKAGRRSQDHVVRWLETLAKACA